MQEKNSVSTLVTDAQLIFDADAPNPYNEGGQKGYFPGITEKYFVDAPLADYDNDRLLLYEASGPKTKTGGNPFTFKSNGELSSAYKFASSGFRIMHGYVVSKIDGLFRLTTQDLHQMDYSFSGLPQVPEYDASGEYAGVYIQNNFNVFAKTIAVDYYDKEVVCRKGTINDIKSYKEVGKDCSRVIAEMYEGEPWEMIIINDYRN